MRKQTVEYDLSGIDRIRGLPSAPMQIYTHIKTNFLSAVDTDREILKTRLLLKAPYDPDHIPQQYYKVISDAWILLTALRGNCR